MKRLLSLVLSLLLCLMLSLTVIVILGGCGNSGSAGSTGKLPAGDQSAAEQQAGSQGGGAQPAGKKPAGADDVLKADKADEDSKKGGTEGVDVDLTVLSSTMVYSEVYNMVMSPENYIGKTVKMDGSFAMYHDEASDRYYFACIIADATACCSQGIEFVLTDKYTYPDDYPEEGGEICVTGVFDTYQEGENTYCTLRNAEIVS